MFRFDNRNSLDLRVDIERGDLESVKEAISSGGTGIKEDIDDMTMLALLRLAVEKEDIGFIKTLAENGVNLNLSDSNGRAINKALEEGRIDVVTILALSGAALHKIEFDLFKMAIGTHDGRDTDMEFLHLLVKKGVNIHCKDSVQDTPMHYAFANGKIAAIDYLLSQEADINFQDSFGRTPLHALLSRDFLDVQIKAEIASKYLDKFDLDKSSTYEGKAFEYVAEHYPGLVSVLGGHADDATAIIGEVEGVEAI